MASVVQAFITQKGPRAKGEGKVSGLERWTYGVTYQVEVDSVECPPKVVSDYFKRTSTLPWFGRKWKFNGTSDAGAICSEIDVQYIEKSSVWFTVDCTFTPLEGDEPPDTRPEETEEGEPVEDPLRWRKEISITSSQSSFPVQEAIFRGFDPPNIANPFLRVGMKTPPVNSAIVPFDPPPEFDRSFVILRVAKRWPAFDEQIDGDPWRDLVNNEPFFINWPIAKLKLRIPAFRGRIKAVNATSQFENNIQNWRVETEVWIHPISWREHLADLGTVRRKGIGDPDGAGGIISVDDVDDPGIPDHEQIKDGAGYPLMSPVLLDGNGQPIKLNGAGDRPRKPPVWLNYQFYKEGRFHGCPNITDVVG